MILFYVNGHFSKTKNLDIHFLLITTPQSKSKKVTLKREEDLEEYNAQNGVIVEDVSSGKWRDAGMKEGFLITSINKRPVKDVSELKSILRNSSGEGGILVKGKYPGKDDYQYYGMGW